jgi:hypothetical protein
MIEGTRKEQVSVKYYYSNRQKDRQTGVQTSKHNVGNLPNLTKCMYVNKRTPTTYFFRYIAGELTVLEVTFKR